MNPNITTAEARIRKATTVAASATEALNSVRALIDAAVAKALENGATEAELVPLTDLSADLEAKTDTLAAAVVANTGAPA